ncbi:MAG: hypothetical protein IPN96_10045 [Anaerolineales bacterium]|nr:hypothetical protein [Anaerolineales bacterium]
METLQQEGQAEEPQVPAPVPSEEKMNWGRFALDIIETLVLAVILFLESMQFQRGFGWMVLVCAPRLKTESLYWLAN